MHNTEIKVYNIAGTKIDREETRGWLDDIGANEYEIPDEETGSDAEVLVSVAAKRCYKSFQPLLNPNVTKVRTDLKEYLDNILKVGHGSVIEHVYETFAIENVSRVFTGEMNRHRAGWAISEGSMRYIRFTDIPFWMPASILDDPEDPDDIRDKKTVTRMIFKRAFNEMEDNYTQLVELWDMDNLPSFKTKKQLTSCFRRIIGMGVSTGGVWTGNLRGLRHVLTMRCHESAEEEIAIVAH